MQSLPLVPSLTSSCVFSSPRMPSSHISKPRGGPSDPASSSLPTAPPSLHPTTQTDLPPAPHQAFCSGPRSFSLMLLLVCHSLPTPSTLESSYFMTFLKSSVPLTLGRISHFSRGVPVALCACLWCVVATVSCGDFLSWAADTSHLWLLSTWHVHSPNWGVL